MGIGDIFGNLYTGFLGLEDLYGSGPKELADYLWGLASSVVSANQFVGIGFITLGISIAVILLYYYVLGTWMRKPSFGTRLTWLIALAVNCVFAFIAGWQWTYSDLLAGKMVCVNERTLSTVSLPISASNCVAFGGANAIVAFVFFVVLCLICKWGSRDYSHIPF